MEWLFPWLLVIHVLGAIIAFGPGFAAPFLGAMVSREPAHGNFVARYSHRLARGVTIPVAVVVGVTGFGMIAARGIPLEDRSYWWLGLSIVLYLVALGFSVFVQTPMAGRLVELSSAPRAADASGPPPGLRETAAKLRRGGFILLGFIIVITALMVLKPAFGG